MNGETIGYNPNEIAKMPEVRKNKDIINNLAPGKLPTELDLAISNAVIRRMSK
jgi:hypothetical protein